MLVFLQSSELAFFSYDFIVVPKKVPVEKESELSRGGAITFLALFHQNQIHCLLSPTVNDIRRKLYMVGPYSTAEKTSKKNARYYSQD